MPARAAKALVNAILGAAEDDVDESYQADGISEILNVTAGRVKASCEKWRIPFKLGLPETSAEPFPFSGESLDEESFDFVWREEHPFQLQFSASRDAPA